MRTQLSTFEESPESTALVEALRCILPALMAKRTRAKLCVLPAAWRSIFPIAGTISGPDLSIGNLWDNDILDVTAALPAGQTELEIEIGVGTDCTGLSAVALQVEQ